MLYDRFGQPLYTVQEASDVNKQFDEFEHVKQVANELYKEWETYSYGIPKKGKIENVPSAEYYEKHYHFLSPEEFEKYGGGVCWDYVEWGVNFLKNKDVKVRTFYIWTETPPNWDTHTFLVIDCGDMQRYVYVESSFKLLKGVWIHNSLDEIIDTITWNMFKCNDNARRFDKFRYVVFEYTGSHPPYGCTCRQYMDWMVNQKDIREGYAEKDKPPAGIVKESYFNESKLSTDERNDLDDNQFGIPELRKYPLTDEKHVLQAVRFFNKAPDEYKEELARNIVKRAKELNMDWENWDVLKPYLPKTTQESVTYDSVSNAKQIAKRIHEQCEQDSKPPTGNQNCLICTWCAEANFRGINALPRPVYSPRDPIFDINGWDIVIKPNKTPIKSKDDVIKKLTVSGNSARYYIHVHWQGGSGGHEFLLLNIDNTIYVMDAQQGFVEPITSKEGSKYFDDTNYNDSFIFRLDNKEFNQTLFDENNDRSKTLKWDDDVDIPYMRKHHMLGEDDNTKCIEVPSKEAIKYLKADSELKQYWKTLYDETVGEILVDPTNGNHIGHVFVWNNEKNRGFIFDLEVKPEYRRKGHGSRLINDAVWKYHGYDLTVEKTNTPAINLYKKYGFEIIRTVDGHQYHMKLKSSKNVQEGAWQDIKNGVNPYSDKMVFHVSPQREVNGQVWKPRVPDYLTPYDPSDTGFEDNTTPRICFSPSIEGALNAMHVNINPTDAAPFDKLYVYIPEKPWKEYKHKTTKELVRDKLVYDANITREVWIMEPVRMKLYGVIKVDQTSSVKRKNAVPTSTGKIGDRFYFTYKWHWLVKPKVIQKASIRDYSTESICENLSYDLTRFKYGLIIDGKVSTNTSESDFNKHWVFHSGTEVDEAGGGNCYDLVEYSTGYLNAYGIDCKKYFMEFTDKNNKHVNSHTICIVPDNNQFIYIEGAFKPIANEIHRMKTFQSLSDIFQYVFDHIVKYENKELKCKVFDYTNEQIDYGTPIKNFEQWIRTKCKCVQTIDINSKPIKEGYTIMNSYRSIQSFLEGNYTAFQEADEDVKEKEKPTEDMTDEELEDDMQQTEKEDTADVPDAEVSNNVGDDSDMDLSDFGNNGGDDLPNNEYDPKEVETLNALVASEASAMSEYMDAAKASHVDVLQRLYSDIGDEERFHMEQLLFAKAELTGEKYIPRDPDVKKEYEELLEMGMDEESAMATAVDKMGLRAKIDESDGDIDVDIETIEHDVEALECAICNTELLLTFMEHAEEVQDQSVINQIITITESYYVQEEVMNTRTMTKQHNPPANLGLALVKAIWSIINLFAKLIDTLKAWLKKSSYKRDRLRQWIDKHGIVGLFSSPISMYIWNDHTNDVDFDDIVYDINLLTYLTRYCGETAKLDDKYMNWFNHFPQNWLPFGMAPNHKNGFPNTPEDAWDKIRGIESIKTRIVVNENNENLLREIFFGKTDKTSFVKFNPNSGSDDAIYKSNNIYNRMEYILDACKFYTNEAGKVMDGYHKIEGDQNSIFYTDHNLYSQNYKYLKGITKNFSTIAHWLSHDMKVVMYLNDGALQEMERYDAEHNNVSDRQQHPNQWGMFADDSHKLDNRNKPIIAPRG